MFRNNSAWEILTSDSMYAFSFPSSFCASRLSRSTFRPSAMTGMTCFTSIPFSWIKLYRRIVLLITTPAIQVLKIRGSAIQNIVAIAMQTVDVTAKMAGKNGAHLVARLQNCFKMAVPRLVFNSLSIETNFVTKYRTDYKEPLMATKTRFIYQEAGSFFLTCFKIASEQTKRM